MSSFLEFNFIFFGFFFFIKNCVIIWVLLRVFWMIFLMKVKFGCIGKIKLVWVIILLCDCCVIWGILEGEVFNLIECVLLCNRKIKLIENYVVWDKVKKL